MIQKREPTADQHSHVDTIHFFQAKIYKCYFQKNSCTLASGFSVDQTINVKIGIRLQLGWISCLLPCINVDAMYQVLVYRHGRRKGCLGPLDF